MKTINALIWAARSIRYHARMHLVLLAGTALTGAILTAALMAGHALNANLRHIALQRIGPLRSALELRGRFLDATLAQRLEAELKRPVAPILTLPTSLLSIDDQGHETRFDHLHAYGIDKRFFDLTGATNRFAHSPDNALLLSARVADQLSHNPSERSLRFSPPSRFPGDMPLSGNRDTTINRRPVNTTGVLSDHELGRFSLRANQIPPPNLFIKRNWLAKHTALENRANLFLSTADTDDFTTALNAVFQPSDAGLHLTRTNQQVWTLQSERLFIDTAWGTSLQSLKPVLSLHYLVDTFDVNKPDGTKQEPYGFITAQTPSDDRRLGLVPADMQDDEIIINAWLAERLNVAVGESLTLRLRQFSLSGDLKPRNQTFTVCRILPMDAITHTRDWMPVFPGLTDVERCADWDIGMPMDPEKLNDPDNEIYWRNYGPTPKAFVTHRAGINLIGDHFGDAMSIRLAPELEASTLRKALRDVKPAVLGATLHRLREDALSAVNQAMDFREIFGSMAFILVTAALILTGLLSALGISQRHDELGILRSNGFSTNRLCWLWLMETTPALLAGSITGVITGLAGAKLLILGINRFWSQAIASAQIDFTLDLQACMLTGGITLLLALITILCSIRRTITTPISKLLQTEANQPCASGSRNWIFWQSLTSMLCTVAAIGLFAASRGQSDSGHTDAGFFFGGGSLLMVALLCTVPLLIHGLQASGHKATNPYQAGILNVARYRTRSMLVMVLLASGCFLTVGVLSMKQDTTAELRRTDSGSGGFSTLMQLSLPTPARHIQPRLSQILGNQTKRLSMRLREGDEASCLNLNRAVTPQLLGVTPEDAQALAAFEGDTTDSVWPPLKKPLPDGAIPVLAGDLTTVKYGLAARTGRQNGTIYEYTAEDGHIWRLRLIGALPVRTGILQGSLIMDRRFFTQMFPSISGDDLWLLGDSTTDQIEQLKQSLGRYGATFTPTRQRLRLLGEVEATYLDMFLVLGGLGVILGAAGIGLVVMRNAAARRRELAILRAMGISAHHTLNYLMAEYLVLLLGGLIAGVIPALIAIQPTMQSMHHAIPVRLTAVLIMMMFVSGLLGIRIAVTTASRLKLAPTLRDD